MICLIYLTKFVPAVEQSSNKISTKTWNDDREDAIVQVKYPAQLARFYIRSVKKKQNVTKSTFTHIYSTGILESNNSEMSAEVYISSNWMPLHLNLRAHKFLSWLPIYSVSKHCLPQRVGHILFKAWLTNRT